MPETILLTGATGFLGTHILYALLTHPSEFHVRATARNQKKLDALLAGFSSWSDKLSGAVVSNAFPSSESEELKEALRGVDRVIHCAGALPGRETVEEAVKNATEGTQNFLSHAVASGVKNVVYISSLSTAITPSRTLTENDWSPVTKESVLASPPNPMELYMASKTITEKEIWAFAGENKVLDIVSLNPPFLYGPLLPPPPCSLPLPAPASFSIPDLQSALSSNLLIYSLLTPTGTFPPTPTYLDVRDVASAAVRALHSSPSPDRNKRIIISSPHGLVWPKVIALIAEKRPDLAPRLTKVQPPELPFDRAPVNWARVKEVLALDKDEAGSFKSLEETILDTVDSLIEFEKEAKKAAAAAASVTARC